MAFYFFREVEGEGEKSESLKEDSDDFIPAEKLKETEMSENYTTRCDTMETEATTRNNRSSQNSSNAGSNLVV